MAINKVTITRILKTAKDFDAIGLIIISYYLRLYLVEKILKEASRPEELTQLASNLLDNIEQFKTDVLASDENDGESNIKLLINDQDKAKLYFINFTMNLYNQKLEQLSKMTNNQNEEKDASGSDSTEQDLMRGFWCCIDLFETILHMWDFETVLENSNNIEEQQQQLIKKRLKYCKLCLSKIAKGELSNGGNRNVVEGSPRTIYFKEDKGTEEQSSSMDERQKEQEEKEEREEKGILGQETDTSNVAHNSDINYTDDSESNFQLPNILADITDKEPELIDSDADSEGGMKYNTSGNKEEDKINNKDIPLDEVQSHHHHHHHHQYSKDELVEMMDQTSKIEKVQKLAKYAISALNYEDIVTAKDQLKEALDLLNSL